MLLRRRHEKLRKAHADKPVENTAATLEPQELNKLTVAELQERCKELGLEGFSNLKKAELVELLEGK